MTEIQPHFEVSKDGLAKLLEKRGKAFALLELLQNAFDEDATRVDVTLEPTDRRGYYRIAVEDDDPDGFTNLAHAYRLFEESEKKASATKRGRFNLGEKLVVAVCESMTIATTTGTVVFTDKGRQVHPRKRRKQGSLIEGVIRMNRDEYEAACHVVATVLIPENLMVFFNGKQLMHREPLRSVTEQMPTEVADAEGYMRPTRRKTEVSLYEVLPGETAHIYEMGIPVVETDLRWHVDVGQKVPVNFDRDNVTPGYRKQLVRIATEAMHADLTPEDAASGWAKDALADENISAEAVDAILTGMFGEDRVNFDPSDLEANKRAAAAGLTVIPAKSLTKAQWKNVKKHGASKPAGQVTPSPKPFEDESPEGTEQRKYLDRKDWTPGMVATAEYSQAVARQILGVDIVVRIINDPKHRSFIACYGGRELTYNLQRLGRAWFEQGVCEEVNDLLIHELGHELAMDHLSDDYYHALTKIAARMVQLAIDSPDWFIEQHARWENMALA